MNPELLIAKIIVASICTACALVKYAAVATAPRSWRLLWHILPALGWILTGFAVVYAGNLLIGSVFMLAIFYSIDYFLTARESYLEAKRRVPPTTADWLKKVRGLPWVGVAIVLIYGVTYWHYQRNVPAPPAPRPNAGQYSPAPSAEEQAAQADYDSLATIQPR
ncbi:hypothetical protein A6C57_01200 [Fibrella sp. ES10-3-2-2]|nr:hypothetical protein A6C57_01200 [Fibrella sp. ES10-3-2-2]